MIIEWLRMGLFIISGFGYWEFFRSKHGINTYFAPLFTLAVQFSVLFAAGILNCLKEVTALLHGLGFLLFLWAICKNKFRTFAPQWNLGYLGMVVLFFAVGLAVRHNQFTHIDNFTHWATVVRSMFVTDRFPTFQDAVIEFTSYPLGSATLIYFVCKIAGEAEYMQMWAQTYFMLCTILPVFSCCKKNRGIYLPFVLVMTGFLLNYNIPVTELLVDTLMPLAAAATALFIFCHCLEWKDQPAHSPYYAIPLLLWTMNIKHAALMFVIADLGLLYLCVRKNRHKKKQWLWTAGTICFANLVWHRHCDYVFDSTALSRHSLSPVWFQMILGDKTADEVADTVKMVLTQVATRAEGLWLAVWFLLLGLLVWFGFQKEKPRYVRILLGGITLYIVYAIGILAMYVFSMENYGVLLSFTRYMRIVDVMLYYMLTVFVGLLLSKITQKQHAIAIGIILILLTAIGWRWQTGKYLKEKLARCSVEWRQELEAPISMYDIQAGKRYLLCVSSGHGEWPLYLWQYKLQTATIDQIIVTDASQLQIEKNYDYLVILDWDNPVIESWLQDNYPDSVGSQVVKHIR